VKTSSKKCNINLDLTWYFCKTWIGCAVYLAEDPILAGELGAECDFWLRGKIVQENAQNREALFPIPLWNCVNRLAIGLSRTNNSTEAWHNCMNNQFRAQPKLSSFVRIMIREDDRWRNITDEYAINPANGIRGPSLKRRQIYVNNDNNLIQLYENALNNAHDEVQYLRSISYHL
jgi:hypothetical protein